MHPCLPWSGTNLRNFELTLGFLRRRRCRQASLHRHLRRLPPMTWQNMRCPPVACSLNQTRAHIRGLERYTKELCLFQKPRESYVKFICMRGSMLHLHLRHGRRREACNCHMSTRRHGLYPRTTICVSHGTYSAHTFLSQKTPNNAHIFQILKSYLGFEI